MRSICLVVLFILGAACSAPPVAPSSPAQPPTAAFPAGDLIDLSHTYDAKTIYWPTADPFTLDKVADGVTPGGYYYAANNFSSSARLRSRGLLASYGEVTP